MDAGALETRLKTLEKQAKTADKLKAQVEKLEKEVQTLKDIDAINRLQRAYGYYVEHMMGQEIIDCFSTSDGVYLEWIEGRYNGQAGLHRYFAKMRDTFNHELLHQVIQVSGIVTVAPDGLKALGRWYAFGGVAIPMGDKVRENWENSIYEMEYIKEDGVWKILSINWIIPYGVRIQDGWIMPEDIAGPMLKGGSAPGGPVEPDQPMDKEDLRYVTGYIFPFHFVHPVTGKPSSEATLNARLKPIKT